jgi:hypothetical protein
MNIKYLMNLDTKTYRVQLCRARPEWEFVAYVNVDILTQVL